MEKNIDQDKVFGLIDRLIAKLKESGTYLIHVYNCYFFSKLSLCFYEKDFLFNFHEFANMYMGLKLYLFKIIVNDKFDFSPIMF